MSNCKLLNLFGIAVATLCLIAIPFQSQAANKGKTKTAQPTKERLVLMPLRVGEDERNMLASMETALVQGLQQKYEVFSGEQVAQKAKEISNKESHSAKKDCDETRCMQGIAEAFQAELIAAANVTKIAGGYLLALSIQNIFDNKVVYSNSLPCKNCDAFQVVDKLKELSGSSVQATSQETPSATGNIEPAIIPSGNPNDPETALWNEVKTTNLIDDYQTYLTQYPKGKYVTLATSRIKKIQEETANEVARKEQQTWQAAEQAGAEANYQSYLKDYPQGSYAGLAQVRIHKLQTDQAAREEQTLWQTVQASEDARTVQSYLDKYPNSSHVAAARDKLAAIRKAEAEMKPGKVFKDCADCPDMIVIPAGSFDMGSNNGGPDEKPVHHVTLSKPFALGKTEITQGQWKAVMGNNPSRFTNCGDTCPVEQVSWNDAKEFIQKLNAKTGKQYRLPSEAEWEYTCRAGGKNEYCGSDDFDAVAWHGGGFFDGNSNYTTHPIASKQPNAFGLYDMTGNVWEWMDDSYHDNYNGAPLDGSAWQGDDTKRVLRGGAWSGGACGWRSADRIGRDLGKRCDDFGFRVARMLP